VRAIEVVLLDGTKVMVREPKGSELALMFAAITPLQKMQGGEAMTDEDNERLTMFGAKLCGMDEEAFGELGLTDYMGVLAALTQITADAQAAAGPLATSRPSRSSSTKRA